jgi:hypothetical protein
VYSRQAEEHILRLPTLRPQTAPATIRLGQYEQYLGLKKGKAR